jgi:DNA-binding LytR/AlgR family response regulator
MKISICSEDRECLLQLEEGIKSYGEENPTKGIMLSIFNNANSFWDDYVRHFDADILFMDVFLHPLNGIQLAIDIRNRGDDVFLFFVASDATYALDGYKVHCLNYLLKPISREILYNELSYAISLLEVKMAESNRFIFEKNDSGLYRIFLDDILYIETTQRYTTIHTTHGEVVSRTSMKDHLPKLGNGFFRIHNAHIVNQKYIRVISSTSIELLNGDVLCVSKHKRKDFIHALEISYN